MSPVDVKTVKSPMITDPHLKDTRSPRRFMDTYGPRPVWSNVYEKLVLRAPHILALLLRNKHADYAGFVRAKALFLLPFACRNAD